MMERYYSVEEVAEAVGMHPKTVARFIREGKLIANKVGKAWRISGHALSVFAEGNHGKTRFSEKERQPIRVTTVVDIPNADKEMAIRIANTLTAAANSKDASMGQASVSTQYIENEYMLRIMLWGSPGFTEVMMGMIIALTD